MVWTWQRAVAVVVLTFPLWGLGLGAAAGWWLRRLDP